MGVWLATIATLAGRQGLPVADRAPNVSPARSN